MVEEVEDREGQLLWREGDTPSYPIDGSAHRSRGQDTAWEPWYRGTNGYHTKLTAKDGARIGEERLGEWKRNSEERLTKLSCVWCCAKSWVGVDCVDDRDVDEVR